MGLNINYYLNLTFHSEYNTFTWTLDYTKKSDFGKLKLRNRILIHILVDSVGHWQVEPHPKKM